ncbi:MAG: vitamin K epoxide reductase family protein [Candidatus Colwellbacteria bacterium]|nr:vitamin K epoxide reductase family protein [Candidatus Colwellbacteria bacterium]MBI3088647.1 vitamin K epoxide reductase family protein [Candidatus Colwellbacteria bacterium]
MTKWIPIAFLILSLIGLIDASYLTAKHYTGTPINCSFLNQCDKVTTSEYATAVGIPIALLGAIYYLTVFILSAIYLDKKRERILNFTARLTTVGFLISLWLVYLQLFVIKAICIYCVISAATSTLLFVLGIITLKRGLTQK